MNKLICTPFSYSYTVAFDGKRHDNVHGSYLGRKAATPQTIRRFIHGNWRRCQFAAKLHDVRLGTPHESQWVAK